MSSSGFLTWVGGYFSLNANGYIRKYLKNKPQRGKYSKEKKEKE
jgi:hypothetical protein